MRILLAHNSLYYPSHGGGDKSNRLLMEALAARGHVCRVVARTASHGEAAHAQLFADLAARGVACRSTEDGVVEFAHQGVEIRVAAMSPNLRSYFARTIAEFRPQVVLASTDDPAQLLLEAALRTEGVKVVYLVRATLAVPFGPEGAFPSDAKTAVLRNVDAMVGVSRYVADYVRRWSGIPAVHVPISLMEAGPFPDLGRFDNEFVTLVNPCVVKGLPVFVALAERFPSLAFAAVPTWGTNEKDRAALARLANVQVLDPVDRIDKLLERTRVLLVPSLWAEARSRIVVEAMLRGVPVIASNVGGIPEAKMGVDYLLPVRPIERYRTELDEQMVPVAEAPEQDIGPWEAALRRLTTDSAHYREVSRASREAALRYVGSLGVEPFERLLDETLEAPARERVFPTAPADRLSPEKRRLLALRLQKKAAPKEGEWFPGIGSTAGARLRLYCFPPAGGGAAAFLPWADRLPPGVAVCPARLPGRESRAAETPLRRMDDLVSALAAAVEPHLEIPFAFLGHSMGAVVGFELVRRLLRAGRPLPRALFAAAARAPQFRRHWTPPPDPTREQFLQELERLEGVPREALDNPDLLRVLLPALEADAALYRRYVYTEDEPLPCPIFAYGGLADPNVTPAHLEAWSAQTTGEFGLRLFPAGHFFVQTLAEDFLGALAADIGRLDTKAEA